MGTDIKRDIFRLLLITFITILLSIPCYADPDPFATNYINSLDDFNSFREHDEENDIYALTVGKYLIDDSVSTILILDSELPIGLFGVTSLRIGNKNNSDTLLSTNKITVKPKATLVVNASNTSAHSLRVVELIQEGGSIEVYGSEGSSQNYAIDNTYFEIEDGFLTAVGGFGDFSIGLHSRTFLQEGGKIFVRGGAGGDGIYVSSYFIQDGGTIDAFGGTDVYAYAIYSNAFLQYSGEIASSGGSGVTSPGMRISGQFIQVTGDILASGGSGGASHGIWTVGQFIQEDGQVVAFGGSATEAYGLAIDEDLVQVGGLLVARGGSSETSYGINVHQQAYIGWDLLLLAGGNAPALRVGMPSPMYSSFIFKSPPITTVSRSFFAEGAAITFGKNSYIEIGLDFASAYAPPYIEVTSSGVHVETGSTLRLSFINFDKLEVGGTREFTIIKLNSAKFTTADLFRVLTDGNDNYTVEAKLNGAKDELIVSITRTK